MSSSLSPPARVRVDARRNRERMLEIARNSFSKGSGVVSLEAIAREAGVGIGTLYRHFPTRDDLVEAVYRSELADVLAKAGDLLNLYEPATALRLWMAAYAEFVMNKRGMAESLRSLLQSGTITSSQTRQQVIQTIRTILDAGVRAGTLRADVRADDVAASLVGVFLATPESTQTEQTGRMLDLLLAGIRATRTAD